MSKLEWLKERSVSALILAAIMIWLATAYKGISEAKPEPIASIGSFSPCRQPGESQGRIGGHDAIQMDGTDICFIHQPYGTVLAQMSCKQFISICHLQTPDMMK